jgi:hypothetical protein
MKNTKAKNYINHNKSTVMPNMYPNHQETTGKNKYHSFAVVRNMLDQEYLDDIPENEVHNRKIAILGYIVKINEIIYHHFKDKEPYIHINRQMLNSYNGSLNVLLKTIEDLYFEMYDRRKDHIINNYTEMPVISKQFRNLTADQIGEQFEQDARTDKNIREHIEFNKQNGFYHNGPDAPIEPDNKKGMPLPFITTDYSKPGKKKYLVYVYDNTGIPSPLDQGINLTET